MLELLVLYLPLLNINFIFVIIIGGFLCANGVNRWLCFPQFESPLWYSCTWNNSLKLYLSRRPTTQVLALLVAVSSAALHNFADRNKIKFLTLHFLYQQNRTAPKYNLVKVNKCFRLITPPDTTPVLTTST